MSVLPLCLPPPHTHTDTPLSLPSLSFLSPAGPTVSLPACFFPLKLLQLEPTNYQHVQSADRSTEGENTNHKVQVQHSSPVLYCIVAACSGFSAALTPDGLNKTDPGLPSSVLVAKKKQKKGRVKYRKERRGVKLLYWPENQCKQSVPGPQPSSCSSQWEAQAGLVC